MILVYAKKEKNPQSLSQSFVQSLSHSHHSYPRPVSSLFLFLSLTTQLQLAVSLFFFFSCIFYQSKSYYHFDGLLNPVLDQAFSRVKIRIVASWRWMQLLASRAASVLWTAAALPTSSENGKATFFRS